LAPPPGITGVLLMLMLMLILILILMLMLMLIIVIGSLSLYFFDRLLYICARSLQRSPTPTSFAQFYGDAEGDSGDTL
jgi:hypothetical protein